MRTLEYVAVATLLAATEELSSLAWPEGGRIAAARILTWEHIQSQDVRYHQTRVSNADYLAPDDWSFEVLPLH